MFRIEYPLPVLSANLLISFFGIKRASKHMPQGKDKRKTRLSRWHVVVVVKYWDFHIRIGPRAPQHNKISSASTIKSIKSPDSLPMRLVNHDFTSGPTNRVPSIPPETEVRAPCPVGRNKSVHTSVPLVRYEMFRDLRSLYSPPRDASTPRFSFRIARHAASHLQPMELAFLVAHRAHRCFASKQSMHFFGGQISGMVGNPGGDYGGRIRKAR